MEKDEIEVEETEEEIREVRASNVRDYFVAKKNGMAFVPRSTESIRRYRRGENVAQDFKAFKDILDKNDLYVDEVKNQMDHIESIMKMFIGNV